MTPKAISDELLSRVHEASGKPVIVQQHSDFSGHATLRLGPEGAAANVLFYKPALEAELPYLIAFQCKLVLRSLEMKAESRFNLEATGQLKPDVERLVRAHLQINSPGIPERLIPQLCSQFASGLGVQLRSMPIAMLGGKRDAGEILASFSFQLCSHS